MIALNLDGIIYIVLFILLVPPLILFGIGYSIKEKYEKASKNFYLFAVLYLLVGIGICFGGF